MIVAYLTFNGNTEEAFNFYKSALGGEITSLQRYSDTPYGQQMAEAERSKVMHIALEGPRNIKLMGNDFVSYSGETFNAGNNFSLSFHPDDKDLADELFNKLSDGGNVIVPLSTAPWGAYFGMFIDRFGLKWMINHENK